MPTSAVVICSDKTYSAQVSDSGHASFAGVPTSGGDCKLKPRGSTAYSSYGPVYGGRSYRCAINVSNTSCS